VRQGALAVVEEAQALLASPLDAGPDAKTCHELGRRLEKSMRVMASLTFCLHEWDEPGERRAEARPPWTVDYAIPTNGAPSSAWEPGRQT